MVGIRAYWSVSSRSFQNILTERTLRWASRSSAAKIPAKWIAWLEGGCGNKVLKTVSVWNHYRNITVLPHLTGLFLPCKESRAKQSHAAIPQSSCILNLSRAVTWVQGYLHSLESATLFCLDPCRMKGTVMCPAVVHHDETMQLSRRDRSN